MKKEDILKKTQKLVDEYLGTNGFLIHGEDWSEERLLNRLNEYEKMVEFKREADKILNRYSDVEIILEVHEDIPKAYELRRKARDIWCKDF